MELVFVHIGSRFGNLENHSFNLSSEIVIEYDSKGSINVFTNKLAIPNLFGKPISDVTGVVGKNGVGKTTLIRYIKELFYKVRKGVNLRTEDVIVYKNNHQLILYYSNHLKEDLKVDNKTNFQITHKRYNEYPKLFDLFKDTLVIYYSNNLDFYPDFIESPGLYNISTSYLLQKIGSINGRLRNRRIRYQNSQRRFQFLEFRRQLRFFREYDNAFANIPFKKIDTIEVKINERTSYDYKALQDKIEKNILTGLKNEDQVRHTRERLRDLIKGLSSIFYKIKKEDINISNRQLLMAQLNESLFFELINCLLNIPMIWRDLNETLKFIEINIESVHSSRFGTDSFIESASEASRLLKSIRGNYGDDIASNRKTFHREDKLNEEAIEKVDILTDLHRKIHIVIHSFLTEVGLLQIPTSEALVDDLIDFYYSAPLETEILAFHWPKLSAGEESLVAFFSRLFDALHTKSKNRTGMILLIDEGDLYFHPEWQKRYFSYLVKFIRSQINSIESIHILLTTHSPFLVSDLPKSNLILMNSEGNKITVTPGRQFEIDTFSGNIPTLYSKAFFLEKRTMSLFSYEKLQEVVSYIKGDDVLRKNLSNLDIETVRKIISVIGEPILKQSLLEMFNNRGSDDIN